MSDTWTFQGWRCGAGRGDGREERCDRRRGTSTDGAGAAIRTDAAVAASRTQATAAAAAGVDDGGGRGSVPDECVDQMLDGL
jgi:hypothetical protein